MAEEALAKARAIAARLSSGLSGGTDLGKRKFDDGEGASGAGLGLMKKKKLYLPVKDYPEVNFLGLLIGPRGSTQKQLQEATGAKLLLRGKGAQKDGAAPTGHPDDEDELHVSIEGTEEAVERAFKEVQQIIYNPEQAMKLKQEQLKNLAEINGGGGSSSSSSDIYGPGQGSDGEYQVELRVPNGMVGLIIGKGGENIHRMQNLSGGHMQIAKESEMKPGETHRSIVLKGTPACVAELKKLVEGVVTARLNGQPGAGSSSLPGASGASTKSTGQEMHHSFVLKVPVPNDKVGLIIGKGGMTIKAIQERTRTNVLIPPVPDEADPTVRTISIGGDTRESVDGAQMEIFMALQQHQLQQQQQQASAALTSPANALYLAIPDDKIGLVIGKGGVTIKEIQNRCQVKIQIPQSADPGTTVRTCSIAGAPQNQHLARYEIEMVLQGQSHNLGSYGSVAPAGASSAYGAGSGAMGGQMQTGWNQYGAAGAYGTTPSYGFDMQQQQQQAYYGQQQQAAAQQVQDPAAVPTDPTAYYNDFWAYVSYYGEPAARQFYGAWSPPEGTPPPAAAGGTVAISSTVDQSVSASTDAADGNVGAVDSSGNTGLASGSEISSSDSISASTADPTVDTAGATGATIAAATTGSEDPAAAAWEAYKKQYSEWYEAYGKLQGADPNPPRP